MQNNSILHEQSLLSNVYEALRSFFSPFRTNSTTEARSVSESDKAEEIATKRLARSLSRLVINITVGTLLFVLIAATTIFLTEISIKYIASAGTSSIVIHSLKIMQFVMLAMDFLVFLIFIVRASVLLAQELRNV